MNDNKHTLKIIGHIHTDFPEKFGIPRQSGIDNSLKGVITFLPEYGQEEAFRGLDEYSHIWVIWSFSENPDRPFNATVKPPRLGGNKRMGVFATRSPFRPNDIGLSCLKLDSVKLTEDGPVLLVSGVDQMDGTPIYDIKPYIPYTDCHTDAVGGFADKVMGHKLNVEFPEELLDYFPDDKKAGIITVLKDDPRPAYHNNEDRRYGVSYAGMDVHFTVKDDVLTVFEVVKL